MKTPTIEEVKEFFKDAKEVECNEQPIEVYRNKYKINIDTIRFVNENQIVCNSINKDTPYVSLWYKGQYAKIISYKSNPNIDLSKLTTDHIIELCKDENIKEFMINNGVVTEPKKEETYIKIPLSIITLTESDKKLGALVRSISENY
jgi:hypothetical protein